jgi:Sec-independent protein translocase protein TatA
MDILGIGAWELFFIVLVALIFLGPKDMVKAGRSLGKFLRKTILSPEWLNIQRTVRNLPQQLMRETGIDENDFKIDLEKTDSPVTAKPGESSGKKAPAIAEEWVTPPKPAPAAVDETESTTSPEPSPPTQKSTEDTESD